MEEVIATNLMEMKGWSRKKAVMITSLATFIFGIPSALSGAALLFPDWQSVYGQSFMDTIDLIASTWLIPLGGLITALFIGWKWDLEEVKGAFSQGEERKQLFWIWYAMIRYLVPFLILLIILQKSGMVKFG